MKAYRHYSRYGCYFTCTECKQQLFEDKGELIHLTINYIALVPDILCPKSKCSFAGHHFLLPEPLTVELKDITL